MKFLRNSWRLTRLFYVLTSAGVIYIVGYKLTGRARTVAARAEWMQKTARRILRLLRIKTRVHGTPPTRGLLVSNHLSYLDIIVYGAHQPLIFVSKADVKSWPLLGTLVGFAGTLFINREKRSDVGPITAAMAEVIGQGVVVVIFPEGTSSGGENVLPFRSSLLAPAAEGGFHATPTAIQYKVKDGSAADEVCYWRDMTFGPHLFNLVGKDSIEAVVRYGAAVTGVDDRKELTRRLHVEVSQLLAQA